MPAQPTGGDHRPGAPQSSLVIVLFVLLMSGGVPADVATCVSETLPMLLAST